jgi:DUF971 family protein
MNIAPSDIKALRDKGVLKIFWPDGSETCWAFKPLRCACRCAGCVDEFTGVRILDPAAVPEDITIRGMDLVGAYALRIVWSDGHDTGLFTWARLRQGPESE